MIDAVVLKRNGRIIFEKSGGDQVAPARPPVATEIEIAIDQHFGVRIVQSGHWTTISFREAGDWSEPEDTRQVVREALRQ